MINITAVIVSYNRADLLQRAYLSIRAFSAMPVIIVDGSSDDDPCDAYSRSLATWNTKVINARKNVGHGRGMDIGIKEADTKYILLMDSDAEIMDTAVIERMLAEIDKIKTIGVFGCGQLVTVNCDGTNVGSDYPDPIEYLHPHFAIIDREIYFKVPGFVHHGAPCLRTMEYINNFKKYALIDFPVSKFVNHEGRGTRSLNPEGFLKGWE